jgi:hypothetical protein
MSRLNEIDSNILLTGKNIDFNSTEYSYLDGEFGENLNDYVEVLIYDEEENFLESGIVDKGDYTINSIDVKLKTGTILRKFGYDRGRYVVKYNFFRKLAGSYENLLVDENQISLEQDTELNINEQTGKITADDGREVFIKENKYLIHEISPSRTELRIIVQNIRDNKYQSEFFNLQRNIKLITSADVNQPGEDPQTVSFTGADPEAKLISTQIELPIVTTTNMVGGFVYLQNAYVSPIVTSTGSDPIKKYTGQVRRRLRDSATGGGMGG